MPVATVTQARDDILAVVKTALEADPLTAPLVSGGRVIWDDSTVGAVPGTDTELPSPPGQPWLRVGLRHAAGRQASLGSDTGRSRFERSGTLFIQVFTPVGDGMRTADQIVDILLRGIERKTTPSGAWFRNGRFEEAGKDGTWQTTLVLVDFQYDQIR